MREKIQRQLVPLIAVLRKKRFVISIYEREMVVNFILSALTLGECQLKEVSDPDPLGRKFAYWLLDLPEIPLSPIVSRSLCRLFHVPKDAIFDYISLSDLRICLPDGVDPKKHNIDSVEAIKQFLLDSNCEFKLHIRFHYKINRYCRSICIYAIFKNESTYQMHFVPTTLKVCITLNSKPVELRLYFNVKKYVTTKRHIFHVRETMTKQYKNYIKTGEGEYLFYNPINVRKDDDKSKEVTFIKMAGKDIVVYAIPQCIQVECIGYHNDALDDFLVKTTDYLVLERVDEKIIVRPMIKRIETKEYMLTLKSDDASFSLPLKLKKAKLPLLFFDVKMKKWIVDDSTDLLFYSPTISLLYHQRSSKNPDMLSSAINIEDLRHRPTHLLSFYIDKIKTVLDDLKNGDVPSTFVNTSGLSKNDISLLIS